MKEYSFNNIQEVNTFLESIDISVPGRNEGRKTEHTERYSIISFLLKTKNEVFTDFPAKLIHYDKPDFRILTKKISIGIEVTESIPEQLARANYLLDHHFPNGGLLEPVFFGWDAPERTNDEIIEILKKSNERLIGQPSYGNSIEVKWMRGIYDCIKNKTQKLNKDDFEKYSKNWLLIYDNQTRIFLDSNYLLVEFPSVLNEYFNDTINIIFDKIIIETGNDFYFIDSESNPLIKILTKKVG